jgi:hypothetical protein
LSKRGKVLVEKASATAIAEIKLILSTSWLSDFRVLQELQEVVIFGKIIMVTLLMQVGWDGGMKAGNVY